jgi:hypothetical protein
MWGASIPLISGLLSPLETLAISGLIVYVALVEIIAGFLLLPPDLYQILPRRLREFHESW